MRVIAVDPGYERCGIAVVESASPQNTLLYSSCLTTSSKDKFEKRLVKIADGFEGLIREWEPDSFAVERLYFNTNQKTAMAVAEVRGALIYMAEKNGLPMAEYTPSQIKTAIAGWGRADKKQIIAMLPRLIHMDGAGKLDDEYDAIATALTHLASARKTG